MQIIISFWNKSLLWTNIPPKSYIDHFIGWNSPFILLSSSANLIFFSCCLSKQYLQYQT